MGQENNTFLNKIPDLTHEATKITPSLLLSSNDSRIDKVALKMTMPFLIWTEASPRIAVIVNPQEKTGFLWWIKSSRIKISELRFKELQSGKSLTKLETLFFNKLK